MKKSIAALLICILLAVSPCGALAEATPDIGNGQDDFVVGVDETVTEREEFLLGADQWPEDYGAPGESFTSGQSYVADAAMSAESVENAQQVEPAVPESDTDDSVIDTGLALENPEAPEVELSGVNADMTGDAAEAFPGSGAVRVDNPADLAGEDLYAGYLSRLFRGSASGIPMATTEKGDRLTAPQREVYDMVKPLLLEMAEGKRSTVEIYIPASTLLVNTQIKASNDHFWDFAHQIDEDMQAVINALYTDCKYELYWAKYGWYERPDCDYEYEWETEKFNIDVNGSIRCYYTVKDEFALDEFTLNTAKLRYAFQAVKNAKGIVKQYAGYSDYAKLYAYAVTICNLVDYNYAALEPDWDPNNFNPYRLLWVFDGDPATEVVCQGYAEAFQYLCEMTDFDSGVRCYQVSGLAGESEDSGHAWNIVRMDDGKNYVIDVTWMDPWDDARDISKLVERMDGRNARYGRSDSWFLVGAGSGSVASGYYIDYMGEKNDMHSHRRYYDDTKEKFGNSVLSLAKTAYTPTGFMRVDGKTYYFDANGHYVTGKRKIGDTYYEFGSDGAMCGAWAKGWQTINGKRYYFDANGLHKAHKIVRDEAVPATCTKPGKTEGSHCSVCKTVLKAQEVVPAFEHVPAFDEGYNATCAHEGRTDGSHCSICGAVLKAQKPIPTLPHTPAVDNGHPATCYYEGLSDGSHCTVCNAVITPQQPIPMLPHTPVVDYGYPATCYYEGLTDGSHCGVCNMTLAYQQPIPTQPHTPAIDYGYPAGCNYDGLTDGSHCAVCGATLAYQQGIPATGHIPVVDAGYPPTNTTSGLTDGSHCVVCGEVIVAQQGIPPLTPPLALSRVKNNGSITLTLGEMRRIVPDFATASGWTVSGYATNKPAIVSIDGNGFLTAKAEGKAKITVHTAQKKKATVTIQVVDPYKPTAIAIAQGKAVTIAMGQPLQLSIGLAPQTARATLAWTSNKPKVASVDQNGLVMPQGEGKAKITVQTHNRKKATITVQVVDPNKPMGVAIGQGKAITIRVGQSVQLSAALIPATARSTLTWVNKKPAIAAVDANGVLTGVKRGKTKVTVMTYNKKKAVIAVNVVE